MSHQGALEAIFFEELEITRVGAMLRELHQVAPVAAEHSINAAAMVLYLMHDLDAATEEDVFATAIGMAGHDVGKGMHYTAPHVEGAEEFTAEFRRDVTMNHTHDGGWMMSLFCLDSELFPTTRLTCIEGAYQHHGHFEGRPPPRLETIQRLTIIRTADLIEAGLDPRRQHREMPLSEAAIIEKAGVILGEETKTFGLTVPKAAKELCIIRRGVVKARYMDRVLQLA